MAEGRRHGDARSRRLAGHASACAAMPSCAVPRSEPASQGRPAGGPGRLPWRPAERAPHRCAAHGGFESRVTVVVCGVWGMRGWGWGVVAMVRGRQCPRHTVQLETDRQEGRAGSEATAASHLPRLQSPMACCACRGLARWSAYNSHPPPPGPHPTLTPRPPPRGCGRRRRTPAPRPSSCRRGRGP